MSKFILVIIFFPLIQIFLGSIKKEAFEKEVEGVLYLPKGCKTILNICSGVTAIVAIVLAVFYELTDNYAVCMFFFILCMLYLILGQVVQRYNIIFNNTYMIITPPIGKRKKITFEEIEKFQESLEGGIKVFSNGRKVITIDKLSVGFCDFCDLLEQKGFKIEAK